jgi:Stc1 domain
MTRRTLPAEATCAVCRQTLPRTEFSRNQFRHPVERWRCRPCGKAASRAWGQQPFSARAMAQRPDEPRGPLSPREVRRAQIVAWVERRRRQNRPADLEALVRWARRAHYNVSRPEDP